MTISYYANGTVPRPLPGPMRLMLLVNATFGAAILTAWTYMAVFLAEPIAWATWFRVYRANSFIEMLEYPFVMLWLPPLACVCTAWIAEKAYKRTLAYALVMTPLLMNSLIVGWFHFAPPEWR